jgi:hypothetical protein
MLTLSKFGIGIADDSFFSGEDIGNLFNFIHDVAKTMRKIDTQSWECDSASRSPPPNIEETEASK